MDYKSFLLILFLLKPEVNGFGEDFKRKDIQKADMRFAASKTSSTSPDDIHFYAFTKNQDRTNGLKVDIGDSAALASSGFTKGKRLNIIIHGFMDTYNSNDTVLKLIQAYVDHSDSNVVSVDWDKLTSTSIPAPFSFIVYFDTLRNIPTVGMQVTKFIQYLTEAGYVSGPENVHLLGHSLGAHISASTGSNIMMFTGKKIARITGLDVAGPFINLLEDKDRLTPVKAQFVDNVHSDILLFGTDKAVGTVDFYANGGAGFSQPKCLLLDVIFNFRTSSIFCAHTLSIAYFAETVSGVRKACCPCQNTGIPLTVAPCPAPAIKCRKRIRFGEFVNLNANGKYYLEEKL